MSNLHEANISKARKIIGYILSILPSLMICFSGSLKIMQSEMLAGSMETLGLLEIMPFIGVLEIFCVVLYWIPKTSNIGFFLLCSYTGGIIVSEMILGASPIIGIVVATLFYIGTMLRKPSLSGLGL